MWNRTKIYVKIETKRRTSEKNRLSYYRVDIHVWHKKNREDDDNGDDRKKWRIDKRGDEYFKGAHKNRQFFFIHCYCYRMLLSLLLNHIATATAHRGYLAHKSLDILNAILIVPLVLIKRRHRYGWCYCYYLLPLLLIGCYILSSTIYLYLYFYFCF